MKEAKDVHNRMRIQRAEELHRRLNKAIRLDDSKLFAQVIKKKERSMTGTTNRLVYKDQTYLNKDVLKGFAEKALDESAVSRVYPMARIYTAPKRDIRVVFTKRNSS